MSVILTGFVLNMSMVTMSQKMVLLALANAANDVGWGVMPPGAALRTHTGLPSDEVGDVLEELYDPEGLDLINMFMAQDAGHEGANHFPDEQLLFVMNVMKIMALVQPEPGHTPPPQPSEDDHG